jgi:hypothetical protein
MPAEKIQKWSENKGYLALWILFMRISRETDPLVATPEVPLPPAGGIRDDACRLDTGSGFASRSPN